MKVTELKRSFKYKDITLNDIPNMSLEEIKDFYSNTYPELINANISAPDVVGEEIVYTFSSKVGVKG